MCISLSFVTLSNTKLCFLAVLNIKNDIPNLALAVERLDWTLIMIVFNSRTLISLVSSRPYI